MSLQGRDRTRGRGGGHAPAVRPVRAGLLLPGRQLRLLPTLPRGELLEAKGTWHCSSYEARESRAGEAMSRAQRGILTIRVAAFVLSLQGVQAQQHLGKRLLLLR